MNPVMANHARRFAVLGLVLLLAALSGCSLPRIIVLHDPLSADEHIRLGSIYASQGKTALARDQFRLATGMDRKNTRGWQLLGDAACGMKDYKEAEEAYGKALDLDAKNGDLHNNLAWVYVLQNRNIGKAQVLVEKALELTPDHRPYYLDTLGVIRLKQGEINKAITALTESADTLPKDPSGPLADAYLHLSEAYAAAGNSAAAEEARKRSDEARTEKR